MKLTYASQDGIGWITLSNPPWNSLTQPVFAGVGELREFLGSPDLKCAIVKGEGRHFSSGADADALKALRGNPEKARERITRGKELLQAITYATIPIAAAIRGSCLGAGFEIALACHFRFASSNTMLGFPETERGAMPGFGGTVLPPCGVARPALAELILSGRMIRAQEALALGLVDGVCSTRDLGSTCTAFLKALTEKRYPAVIRAVMEAIHNGRRLPLDEALRAETDLFCKVIRGDA